MNERSETISDMRNKEHAMQQGHFTGLIVVYHDNSNFELALTMEENGYGVFKVEDETLKIEYWDAGVRIQKGFPLMSMKCYEVYFSGE